MDEAVVSWRARLVVVLGSILTIALIPGVAKGHSVIASSRPAPGETLGTAPGVVVLEFTEPLNRELSRATVTDPTGRQFTGGASGIREIRVLVSSNATGIYRVEWETVSTLDGHPWRGSYEFGVGVAPASGSEGTVVTGPNRSDLLIAVARWMEYLALVVAVGMLLVRRLARGRPELDWIHPTLWVPLAVAFAAGVTVVLAEVRQAAGSLFGHSLASYLSGGLPGLSRLARLGLEGLALFAASVRAQGLWLLVAGSIGALAASGHGAAIRPTWWGVTVNAVHLLAAGVWAGGILALATLRPPDGWRSSAARRLLILFSPPALTAFLVTVAFGVVQAAQELGSLEALFGSSYGRVLVAKVVLVGLMLPLSIIAWRLRRPRLRIEGTIAVCVIAVAAILSAFPIPPSRLAEEEGARSAAPSAAALPRQTPAGSFEVSMGGHAGEALVGLTVNPGRPGRNRLDLYVLPLGGNAEAAQLHAEVKVDGRPLVVVPCGDTCRRGHSVLHGGEVVEVTVRGPKGGMARFMLPELPAADGSGLVRLLQGKMHALRTYRLDETLSSGRAVVHSTYVFQAPDRMESKVDSRSRSIFVGRTRYLQERPNGPWEVSSGGPPLAVPSFIWDYFKPFLDARILGREIVEGESTTVVSFFGRTSDVPIWFRLWVRSDGLVLRAEMRAPGHFMDHRYFDFNVPVSIQPPR